MSAQPRKPARRGVALVQALMVVAALAALAALLLTRSGDVVMRLSERQAAQQAQEMLAAGMELSLHQLAQRASGPILPQGGWARLAPITVAGGEVSGEARDLQGRFNLGWMSRADEIGQAARAAFLRLAAARGVETSTARQILRLYAPEPFERTGAFGLSGAWVQRRPQSSLLLLGLAPPAHRQTLAGLLPELAALPIDLGLNPNTASESVLAALWPEVSPRDWEAFAELRAQGHFGQDGAFWAWLEPRLNQPDAPQIPLDTRSQWFELRVTARLDSLSWHRSALVTTDPAARTLAGHPLPMTEALASGSVAWPLLQWSEFN